ncbi:type II secretion system F family protein [Candidatus Peregrinibacteria bacterium]|nr:MAG: type II secretion system F family protein [Candidatus Peregrinibacteria bacterium]
MSQKHKKEEDQKRGLNIFSRIGIAEDQENLLENLSMLVESGMDIPETLRSIATEMRTPQMKRMMMQAEEDIENGLPVWKALEETNILPPHIIALLRIGEESGRLPKNLKMVALQQQKQRMLLSRVRSSLAYPMIVLFLSLFIGVGISWFILPRLSVVFSQLKIDLPFVTSLFIGFGTFLGKYGNIAIPAFLLVFFLIFYFVFFHRSTKHIGQGILLKTPVIHQLIKQAELSRLGYMMGALLEAGISVIEALLSLEKASVFRSYKKLYRLLRENMEEGISFGESFGKHKETKKLIPAPVQQLISSGEQSGNLSQIFFKIGESYEGKTEYTTKNMAALLEPIMLIIIWIGVVSVALAVVLPIYTLVGNMNTGISSPPKAKIVAHKTIPQTESQNIPQPIHASGEIQKNIIGTITPEKQTEPKEEKDNEDFSQEKSQNVLYSLGDFEYPALPRKENIKNIEVLSNIPALNVRSGPSTDFSVLTQIFPGNSYPVREESGQWQKITLPNNEEGWVLGTYTQESFQEIEEDVPDEKSEDTPALVRLQDNLQGLNIRSNPTQEATIIGTMLPEDRYEKIGEEEGWFHIHFEEETGWVLGSLVQETKE